MTHSSSRVRNLGLAAALALLAAVLTMVYVSHGQGGGAQAASETSVLVAAHDLAVGTSMASALAGHAIVLKKVASTAVEPGSLTGVSGIGGDVVVQPIYQGEQVQRRRLGQAAATGVRSVVSGSLRVLQVPGNTNQLLAGTLQAGDHVDVVGSLKSGTAQTPHARTVLTNVLVLEAPQASGGGVGPTTGGSSQLSATVAVTDGQAQTLFDVLENGNWTFVLRPVKPHAPAR